MLPKTTNRKKTLVLIDYANLKSSAMYMGRWTDMNILYDYLKSHSYIDKISIYYGTDSRNPSSFKFITWLRSKGYEVVTKDVKYIRLNLRDTLFSGKTGNLLSQVDQKVVKQIENNISTLEAQGLILEQPKCNLDIEIALDIFNGLDTFDSFVLFSGDSDFESILKIARSKGKHVTIISLRKFTAGEIIKNSDTYINLTSLSTGLPGFLHTPPSPDENK